MIKTKICDLLNIKYPILLGGMGGIGDSILAIAVSKAGGLGVIGAAKMSDDKLRSEIQKLKEISGEPFGVNIPLITPQAKALIEISIYEKVPIVVTSAGNPNMYTELLKEAGIIVIHVVPTVRLAKKAEEAGVDAVITAGSESGGFLNIDEVSSLCLIPQVTDAISLPVIASGGIAEGRGLVAALALGASGVQMGTRFIASVECPASDEYKNAVLRASDTDTVVLADGPAKRRVLKREIFLGSNLESANKSCGQIAGIIREIINVKEIIDCIVQEAQQTIEKLLRLQTIEKESKL